MIAIQLADLIRFYVVSPEQPQTEVVERFRRASSSIANCFTITITEDDSRYLYFRYKKIKNDTGFLELVRRPHLIYYLYISLWGYSVTDLMEQYVKKVEDLGVDLGDRSGDGKLSFSKRPSRMRDGPEFTPEDEHFSDESAELVDCIRNRSTHKIIAILSAKRQLANSPYLGLYPIHTAADVGQIEILKVLLEFGADINCRDAEGQTALHYGASNGYVGVVAALVKSGIDRSIQDKDNLTALEVATDSEIIDLLKV